MTHLKTAWIRRGVGIPASDLTTITIHLTRREDLLTITTIQEDPYYLSEPHVVSRVWQWNPRGTAADRPICNTANEIPSLEDTGVVPHYLPGQNPEEDYMPQFNCRRSRHGYAETLFQYSRSSRASTSCPRLIARETGTLLGARKQVGGRRATDVQ